MVLEGFKLQSVRAIACPVPTQPICAQPFMTDGHPLQRLYRACYNAAKMKKSKSIFLEAI